MLATIYDSPIYQAIYSLMDNATFVWVNAIACITRMSSTRQKNIILKSRKPKLPRLWI